jgi:hypothetical protein
MHLIKQWKIIFLGSSIRMSSFLGKITSGIKGVFSRIKNGFQAITKRVFGVKKIKTHRRRKVKINNFEEPPPESKPAVPVPAVPAAPAVPVPQGPAAPQAAGRKMRAKNIRGMKFYKPSRRVMRLGRNYSRRL